MSEKFIFDVPAETAKTAKVNNETYLKMYEESIKNPSAFWGEHGLRLDWIKPYSKVKNTLFSRDDVSIKWYEDGTLNAMQC